MQEKQYKITFKNNGGRTGNLIFEYMLCKLIEYKYGHKYEAYSLEFEKNEKYFLITDENIETIIPENILNVNIICSGYFQKSSFFVKYRFELIEIMKRAEIVESGFYFEFGFDICRNVGLVYDYNFSYKNKFEICYYDTRDGWIQIRTYL